MDIKLTHSLLTKYLETPAKPEEIAKCLSLCGPTVDRLEKLENGDYLYEIEVITNRVDAASAYGIAREAAAILPEFGITASLKPLNLDDTTNAIKANTSPLGISITNDPTLNHRVLAIKISNVTITDSPAWLGSMLTHLGSRPLNNIIDITNFVTAALGHPIHAFDYDRITNKTIIVREAKKGEVFVTLDNQSHTCIGGEVVFDDGTGTIIDLPGIMGTANTVITPDTKNVLLWIESVDTKKIRKTSLTHQLRTQAAILNEKQVDPNLALTVITQAAAMMVELGKGQIGSQLFDIYPHPVTTKEVSLNLDWLNRFAGIDLDQNKVIIILNRLGIVSREAEKDHRSLVCTIPTFRVNDITIQEDLAEEIMRVYGYFRLPSLIPQMDLPAVPTQRALSLESSIKHQLVKQGATEIFNSSLISDELLSETNVDTTTIFSLANPLSSDNVHMRPSLLPSLKINLEHNKGTYTDPYFLFELANTYQKDPKGPLAIETPTLAMAWSKMSYRQAKGHVEALFHYLHLPPNYEPIQALDSQTFIYEIKLDAILQSASTLHTFIPIPEFTPIIEDLTFTVPADQPVGKLITAIQQEDPYIWKVGLKDIYKQNVTFTISYYDPKRQLATTDIAPIRKQVVHLMTDTFHAKLVGKLQ